MTDFHDVRLPPDIERGSGGGPGFSTTVVTAISGNEVRNINWSAARGKWDISYGIQDKNDFYEVLKFYRARRGRAHGFRFKDWSDFEAALGETRCISLIGGFLLADGIETQWQMQKLYEVDGPDPYIRVITRPVSGSAQHAKGRLTASANFIDDSGQTVTIDGKTYTFQGTLTNVNGNVKIGAALVDTLENFARAIDLSGTPGTHYAAAMTAHPTVTTRGSGATYIPFVARTPGAAGNSISTTESCANASFAAATLVGGEDAVNDDAAPIVVVVNSTIVDPMDYTIDYLTGIITFSDAPSAGPVGWSGEFDVPVRFDVDELEIQLATARAGAIGSIPIVEIRESAATVLEQQGDNMALFGSRGLVCANNTGTPNTQYDLDADEVLLRNALGETAVRINPGAAITNNVSTAGPAVNGRDQAGVFSANSWVHFYWIWNGLTLATISSIAIPPTGPTLPSGYTHWCYAGAVRFNASSQLVKTRIRGRWAGYELGVAILVNGSASAETAVSTSTTVPPNATQTRLNVNYLGGTSDGAGRIQDTVHIRVLTGVDFTTWALDVKGAISTQMLFPVGDTVVPNVGQQIFYHHSPPAASPLLTILVTGYELPNGG